MHAGGAFAHGPPKVAGRGVGHERLLGRRGGGGALTEENGRGGRGSGRNLGSGVANSTVEGATADAACISNVMFKAVEFQLMFCAVQEHVLVNNRPGVTLPSSQKLLLFLLRCKGGGREPRWGGHGNLSLIDFRVLGLTPNRLSTRGLIYAWCPISDHCMQRQKTANTRYPKISSNRTKIGSGFASIALRDQLRFSRALIPLTFDSTAPAQNKK